jgi:hypothetical protein
MAILQVWSGPRCQANAQPLGPLAKVESGRVTEAVSGAQGPTLRVSRAVADEATIRAGAWLWIHHPRRGTSEWPILSVTTGDGLAADTVAVQGGTIRQAIALRGTIRRVNAVGPVTTTFTVPALTPRELLLQYFFTNLAADNLAWLTLGATDYDGTIALQQIREWTRGQLLDAIESATGGRFVFTRLGDAAYQLDLRDPEQLTATEVLLAPGVTVASLEQTEDLVSSATVAEPRAANGESLGETWWTIAAITGAGPWWVRLVDPAGGPPVIREDGQVNGWWLRPNDGLPVAITDSRASDSAVQVSSRTGLVVGTLATVWETESGALAPGVSSPSGVAARDRVVQPVSVAVPSMRANRITDPALRTALASWERVNPSAGGADILRRDDPVTLTMRVNGAVAGGGTSVNVDEGRPNAAIRFGDAMLVEGVETVVGSTTVTNGSGGATLPLAALLPSAIAASVALVWRRNGVDIGSAITSGIQPAGAPSLIVTGLPATPQLASGDQLVRSVAQIRGFGIDGINYSPDTILAGTGLQITETRLIREQPATSPFPILRSETVQYAGTVTADAPPGAGIGYTTSGRPADPSGPEIIDWFIDGITGSYQVTVPITTLTLTGAPPAWNGTVQSTASITGTVGATIDPGERFAWLRGGAALGTVELVTGTVPSDTSVTVRLAIGATRVFAGDVFSVPSQTLYSAIDATLSGTGTGTIPLRVATGPGIADNALLTIQRPRDLAAPQFGGPLVLRLRGAATAAPTVYRGGADFGLYSPIFRVESPNPAVAGGSYNYRFTTLLSAWGAEPGQTLAGFWALWDVDRSERLSFGSLASGTAPFSPAFNITTHTDPTSGIFVSLNGPRRLRVSLHPGNGQSANRGAFLYLRGLAFTVYEAAEFGANPTAALVEGSFSNQGWHRAQDLLDLTRDAARYRVQLGTVAPFADDPAQLLTVGGRVRLRSDTLHVDRAFRVSRLLWSLTNDDALELELSALTPRLSESVS